MRFLLSVLILFYVFFSSFLNGQDLIPVKSKENDIDLDKNAPLNINDWIYWQSIDGLSGHNPYNDSDGGYFPHEKSNVIYSDGFVWAGIVQDPDLNKPQLRAGGFQYLNGTQAGWIILEGDGQNPPQAISPEDPKARIYRIRTDYQKLKNQDLLNDAANLFNLNVADVTEAHIDTLRMMYARDWSNWPGQFGAPYYDNNNNDQWDANVDEPGLANADQIIWYAVNDLDQEKCFNFLGSPPIGIELQVTAWAYKKYRHWFGLDGVIFKSYRLINKSGFAIDSMFIGHFADIDIGNYSDDLAGCDSVLSLGYIYNGIRHLLPYFDSVHLYPPSVGYALMQGAMVPSFGDTALINFEKVLNHTNLAMTSFAYSASGCIFPDPSLGDYSGTLQIYYLLNGYYPFNTEPIVWTHLHGPLKGKPTKFPLNGDPVTGEGDVDGKGDNLQPGDRRIYICSGSFNMQPGEIQEIVFAIIGSEAPGAGNYLFSIRQLKELTIIFKDIYRELPGSIPPSEELAPEPGEKLPDIPFFILGQNYPNPFNNKTTLRFRLFTEMDVTLDIYNHLGQKVKTIYQGKTAVNVHMFSWDGTNDQNILLPSGIYYLRLTDGTRTQVKKLIYLR